jgi:hypothetical protein
MDDNHLLCTIRLLRRWSQRIADSYTDGSPYWEFEDAEMLWVGDEFCKAHVTWNALQFERRMRNLEELPL